MGLLLMSVVIVGMGVPESMAGLFHDNWKLCCVGERKRGLVKSALCSPLSLIHCCWSVLVYVRPLTM